MYKEKYLEGTKKILKNTKKSLFRIVIIIVIIIHNGLYDLTIYALLQFVISLLQIKDVYTR